MAIDIIRKYEQASAKAQRALEIARLNRKRIRALEKDLVMRVVDIFNLSHRLEDVENALEELQEKCNEDGGNGSLPYFPYGPRGMEELRAFVLASLGESFMKVVLTDSMATPCALIRDALVNSYSGIGWVHEQAGRHNYTAGHDDHLDAFVVYGETPEDDYIVDFMYGSSEGGTVEDKLRWGLGGGDGKPDNVDWSIAWDR